MMVVKISGRKAQWAQKWSSLLALCFVLISTPSLAEEPLVFGILPAESPVSLYKRFLPLRNYLSKRLQREVSIESAKDFAQHIQRTDRRRYDIVFTAPHLVLRAIEGEQYQVVATTVKQLSAVVVVPEQSAIRTLKDLEGKQVATPPTDAVVTMVGENYLKAEMEKAGVPNWINVQFTPYRTHNAAYKAALAGDADVAVIANFIYQNAIKDGEKLRKIVASPQFPGMGILVAKDVGEMEIKAIRQAFLDLDTSSEGKEVLKKISLPAYASVNKKDFELMRPYINNLHLLGTTVE